jgi:hypothetical protein
MDVFGVQKEYDWVLRVLKSSKTSSHVDMSNKLIFFFQKKWDGILNQDQKNTFLCDFEREKVKIVKKLKKNTL